MTNEPQPPPWWHELTEVDRERAFQVEKFGDQSHLPEGSIANDYYRQQEDFYKGLNDRAAKRHTGRWDHILLEEVFEALSERDVELRRHELIQVAAVALAWAEKLRGEQS